MLHEIFERIANTLAVASGLKKDEILPTLELGKVGDVSSKLAFVLSKQSGEPPAKIAFDLTSKISTLNIISKVEAAGPYINFYFSDVAYQEILFDILKQKDKFGKGKDKEGKVIIEFPSVNPNKPWHIGHLRNAILGDSVARILKFSGYQVERMDYIDDLGLQVAQSLWSFLNYDSNPSKESKFDTWLGHQYVGVAKKFEEDKEVLEGVRATLKRMEEGDNDIADAGRALAENCVKAQYETSFGFGIYHDVLIFESDILRTIFKDGIDYIKQNDAVVLEADGKNAGCWVVKLSQEFEKEFGKMENPDKVLIRSDGTAVYTGKDVIFHLWKFGKLKNFNYSPFMTQPNGKIAYKSSSDKNAQPMDFGNASTVINVIGVEQKYPQRVIVEVFKRLNLNSEAANLYHLSYEHVGLSDEKFSGRKGSWVGYTADDLLAESKRRVTEKIKSDMDNESQVNVAGAVGSGAIKFSFLKTNSDKRITFKWEEALNMEGDSGPYLQYAYVRAKGILSKAKGLSPSDFTTISFSPIANTADGAADQIFLNDSEKKLLKTLLQFPQLVARCSKEKVPHHLAQYALDVAADFSSFYTSSPVLTAESPSLVKNRLAITLATSIVLKNALNLLGIECPERM